MIPMIAKEYRLRPEISTDSASELATYHPFVQKLLFHRGIDTAIKAQHFFGLDYIGHLHDPYLMKDMGKAVERIIEALERKEKILIYSDYDADGIPGGVLLREFFEKIGYRNVTNYIPHRHDEGYGLHLDAVDGFGKGEVDLMITVDCGIVDVDQISRANEHGIDVIITDHHEPNGTTPYAYAILNPKQAGCQYPEKILCGSGVVFKLIQAILLKNRFGLKEGQEKWFLDLVGIATLSDMVPLTGENRVFAHYGLKVLRKSPRPGLRKLWRKLRVNQRDVTEDDIGFTLSPRINAASRMGEPMDAFKLLFTKDEVEADMISDHLNKINDERKGVVASIVKDIKKHLKEKSVNGSLPKVIVLGNPLWKPALLGLAANSLMDDYSCPVFLWGRNGDSLLKGSCRSDGSVSLIDLMEEAKGALTQFGGHKMAGGFAVSHEKIHALEEELNNAYDSLILKKNESCDMSHDSVNWVDTQITLEDINFDTYRHIEKLAPFGVGNSKPLFMINSIVPYEVRQFGKTKNHLELIFKDKNGKEVSAICFFSKPEKFKNVPEKGKPINLISTMEKSNFRNYPQLRLRVVDIV
ncbi:MAG: single-stranded-DNA-specific exonuclease RecJ [Candidatus Zambryskibacteria bacterium RIFCSPLOWO2_01_FULL_43_17]|uniref:Single-stranded-DNA-specific exonuclease RecJ n=1 Tax=Candidatus Zambryskibacteria bacterium RIFCSPLOWO2_01_FULL_43_17 TaxID=1802760 RepID=A0A1G2U413_9BACT|nr:MAG: single-stranded-DNA-specific exonuclease RecJ [Candidatus Zambryskibacteria bacterium RIFCSPLOWO2_01_FULL_43_17]